MSCTRRDPAGRTGHSLPLAAGAKDQPGQCIDPEGRTAEELIAKRTDVRDQIVAQLRERLARHAIVVDEFSIVNFNFSKSFNEAIGAKTTAEQLKLKAERDLLRIEVEARQRIAQARAEAESLAIQRQQVTPELIRLREMENQRLAIEKWDGKLPNVSGGAVPFINVKSVGGRVRVTDPGLPCFTSASARCRRR